MVIRTNPDEGTESLDAALRRTWGESLNEHLDTLGMSRKQLQHRLNDEHGIDVSLQAISLWVRGERAPKDSTKVAIAEVLNVPVRRLFPMEAAA